MKRKPSSVLLATSSIHSDDRIEFTPLIKSQRVKAAQAGVMAALTGRTDGLSQLLKRAAGSEMRGR